MNTDKIFFKTLGKKTCFVSFFAVLLLIPFLALQAENTPYIENNSYFTLCAEKDNINIPMYAPGAQSVRITATHPAYYPTSIDEKGADWTDCIFVDRQIWQIGEKNGSNAEFKQDGYSDGDEYYAPDEPPAGIDEPVSEFPREINNDDMQNQYIIFTADEVGDFNLTLIIGAWLEVAFTEVTGTLNVEMLTGDGVNWESHGTRTFTSANKSRQWDIPDFTWIDGVDANYIHLKVLDSSSGDARGLYDFVELHKRHEGGETVTMLYNDGETRVDSVHIDFWWRAPRAMTIDVIGGITHTNTHYFRIIRRIPGTEDGYGEVFVMYQDCNARIIPLQPGHAWIPYGSSVQIGATPESDRPYADVERAVIDPSALTIDLTYGDESTAHVQLDVDRERHIVDVTGITYDTVNYPILRLRSMWVREGNNDIARVMTPQGNFSITPDDDEFPIAHDWERLESSWFFFHRGELPSYHNTYCPDFLFEVLDPDPSFLVREGESFDSVSGGVVMDNSYAESGQVLVFDAEEGGEATYTIQLERPYLDVYARLRYTDPAGDRPQEIFLNDEPMDELVTLPTGSTNLFAQSPDLYLGHLDAGIHTLRIVDSFVPGGNLLRNESFEDGTGLTEIYHWTRWGTGIERNDDGWVGPRTGDWALLWLSHEDSGGIYQDFPRVAIGAMYTFSIWGNPTWDWESNFEETRMFIEFKDADDELIGEALNFSNFNHTATDTWTKYSVQGEAPAGTAFIRVGLAFGNGSGQGVFRFDDAELVRDDGGQGPGLDTIRLVSRPEPAMVDTELLEIEMDVQQYLLNTSFENGNGNFTIDNWTLSGEMERADWPDARTGNWVVLWPSWQAGGGVHQEYDGDIEAGDAFTFSIWGNPSGDWTSNFGETRMYMDFRDSSEQSLRLVEFTNFNHQAREFWSLYLLRGTAPAGTDHIRVGLSYGDGSGTGAFFFDDAALNRYAAPVLAEEHSNVYLSIRYAEVNEPKKVIIYYNDWQQGWWPTENTGGAEQYEWGPPIYLGTLPAGTNVIDIVSSDLNMDRMKLVTRSRSNRPPGLVVPSPHTVVMGSMTNFNVLAYDLDDDPVEVTMTAAPGGAVFDEPSFQWAAVPGFGGTTQEVVFVATDLQGEANSWVTNTASLIIPYDSDEDGLPDEWEWIHFGTLEYGPDDDVDGDGITNLGHLIAGTDPNNPASVLRMYDAESAVEEDAYHLTIGTVPGRLYTIYFTDDSLTDNPVWSPFADDSQGVGTWYEAGETESVFTFVDDFSAATSGTPPEDGRRLYRVRVERP